MKAITAEGLSKIYKYYKKEEGIKGSIKNFFKREALYKEAVKGISFSVDAGDSVGFIGLNGAGKTTTLKMLSGILKPTSGKIDICGYSPFDKKNDFLKRITMVMGNKSQLWWDIPAIDAFALNKEIFGVEDIQYNQTLNELVEILDVGHLVNTQVRRLSLGERMKMELILALIHLPDIIFLDEPTIGLDVISQYNIREALKKYRDNHNATIILTSHNLDDIEIVCDKLMIIDDGNIMYDGQFDSFVQLQSVNKIMRIKFKKGIDISDILKDHQAEIISSMEDEVNVKIENEKVISLSGQLMSQYLGEIKDINIENANLQEIIRNLYA
ncbi:MAG: ATP-binding cassette domain-containing protein [Lachnospiraceae bacterium]|nr:ATP-binding cassette domain-containing protein [Lachnospiraceae bacterium]